MVEGSWFKAPIAELIENHGGKILNVRTRNVQKTNIVEKGIGTLLIES